MLGFYSYTLWIPCTVLYCGGSIPTFGFLVGYYRRLRDHHGDGG